MASAKHRPLVAILDACVLVPMPVADTLLRLAEPPALFQARWSDEILAEVTRTLVRRFRKAHEKALYRENAMREFFPEALVLGFESLVASMENHPKDRHVLAAAVACRATYLVTFNLKDFPDEAAHKHGISVVDPSVFLKLVLSRNRSEVEERLSDQAAVIGLSRRDLLIRLAASVPEFVSAFAEP